MSDHPQKLTPEVLVPRIGNYLVEKGLITETSLQSALAHQISLSQSNTPPLIGQILINMGVIDRVTLDQAITEQIIQLRSALQEANNYLERRVRERTEELEIAYHKLTELNRLKSNFIANISHELRTPLTHISGYLELLSNGDLGRLDDDQKQAIAVMIKSNRRLENLIDDLILFSLIDRNKLVLQLKTVNLHEIFIETINQISTKAYEKQIQLIQQLSPDIPDVLADQNRLTWVISQLLDNAIKFTPNGGQVSLKANKLSDFVEISITDSGIGIAEEDLKVIFEPFHQLDGSSTRKFGGTGLGLSLAQEIIGAHDSNITVISKVGHGSQFKFVLKIETQPI